MCFTQAAAECRRGARRLVRAVIVLSLLWGAGVVATFGWAELRAGRQELYQLISMSVAGPGDPRQTNAR